MVDPVVYLKATQTASQGVTANDEVTWAGAQMLTNGPGTFGFNVADPKGILIYRHGLYAILAEVVVSSSDIADQRGMYARWSRVSTGVTFGNPIRPQIGDGQGGAGINEVTALASKSALYHYSITDTLPFTSGSLETDPIRLGVAVTHTGADYAIGTGPASIVIIVRLGGLRTQSLATT